MTLDEIETNIRNLAENKKIMVEQVGAARDLLAELLMSYETLCDLQAREYIRLHKAVKAAELEAAPKKFNYCPHNDCGHCYADKSIKTNAINGGCFKPQECPANQGD